MEWLDGLTDWWGSHWRAVIYSFMAGALFAAVML